MNNRILEISPLRLSVICGLLSAAFSFSSAFLFNHSLFSLIFIVLSYFWLVPILLVSFLHGSRYGVIASSVVLCTDIVLTGAQSTVLVLAIQLLASVYFSALVRQTSSQTSFIGLGVAFSRICLMYLGIMVFTLIFILDIEFLKGIAAKLLKEIGSQDITQVSGSFIQLFPGILSVSSLISLVINILVTFKILGMITPEKCPPHTKNDFQMPKYWDIVFLGSLLPILTQHEIFAFIGKNVLLLSCLPLYLYGLSIVYSWLNQLENWNLWLTFAVVLSIVLVWPAMLVILLGILGPILKIQKDTDKHSW